MVGYARNILSADKVWKGAIANAHMDNLRLVLQREVDEEMIHCCMVTRREGQGLKKSNLRMGLWSSRSSPRYG